MRLEREKFERKKEKEKEKEVKKEEKRLMDLCMKEWNRIREDLDVDDLKVCHVTNSSMLSNPADAQNVSCLGLCGRDIS